MRKIAILIFSFLISAGNILYSQNWSSNNLPRFRQGNDVALLPGYRVVAVGGNETNDPITGIYLSKDTAHTWDLVTDTPLSPWLTSVSFMSPTNGIACGNGGMVQRTTDGGDQWNAVSLPGNASARNYKSVFFLNTTTGFIVGGNQHNDSVQTILKTTDGGASWSILLDRPGSWLRSVFFTSEQNGFAVGDRGTLLKTENGGLDWNTVTLPGNTANRQLNAIIFPDASHGIIAGGNPSNDSIQTILYSSNGGTDWSVISDKPGPMLNAIDFPTTGTGYAVGDYGTVLKTQDGGQNWETVAISADINDARHLYGVDFSDRFYGVAIGQYGKVLVFVDSSGKKPSMSNARLRLMDKGSVKFDAMVWPNSLPTHVALQYGITPEMTENTDLGNGFSGDAGIPVSYTITGLSDHNVYYFRFNCDNEAGSFSTETKTFYAGYDIPNWSFEEWDTLSIQSLDGWKTGGVPGMTEGLNGSRAVALKADSQGPGAIILGDYTGSGFVGGIPFNASPDSVILFASYKIASLDSAGVLLILKKNGNILVDSLYKFTGNTDGKFTRIALGISNQSGETPDSLIFGVLSTNYFAGKTDTSSIIVLDSIGFTGTALTLPNAGFESWTFQNHYQPKGWYCSDQGRVWPGGTYTTSISTEKYHGNLALKLSNVATDKGVMNGTVSTGSLFSNQPSFPVNVRFDSLFASVQFYPSSQDSLQIMVQFFKNGTNIGFGMGNLNQTMDHFVPVAIPVFYNDPAIPDSAQVSFHLTAHDQGSAGTWALIDAVTFGEMSVLNKPISDPGNIRLFPNPANNFIAMETDDLSPPLPDLLLYDLSGRLIQRLSAQMNGSIFVFSVSGVPEGMYLGVLQSTVHSNPHSFAFKIVINH